MIVTAGRLNGSSRGSSLSTLQTQVRELAASVAAGKRTSSIAAVLAGVAAVVSVAHYLERDDANDVGRDDGEAGTDYYVGKLDAVAKRNRQLGTMFFYSIGCEGPGNQHPTPDGRATAYTTGYDEQAAA